MFLPVFLAFLKELFALLSFLLAILTAVLALTQVTSGLDGALPMDWASLASITLLGLTLALETWDAAVLLP
jgi:hypothetical protein